MDSKYYLSLMEKYDSLISEYSDKLNKVVTYQEKINNCKQVLSNLLEEANSICQISDINIKIGNNQKFSDNGISNIITKVNNIDSMLDDCNNYLQIKVNDYNIEINTNNKLYQDAKINYKNALSNEQ